MKSNRKWASPEACQRVTCEVKWFQKIAQWPKIRLHNPYTHTWSGCEIYLHWNRMCETCMHLRNIIIIKCNHKTIRIIAINVRCDAMRCTVCISRLHNNDTRTWKRKNKSKAEHDWCSRREWATTQLCATTVKLDVFYSFLFSSRYITNSFEILCCKLTSQARMFATIIWWENVIEFYLKLHQFSINNFSMIIIKRFFSNRNERGK